MSAADARRTVHDAPLDALAPATLYAILRLRAEVFVVEQGCAYLDPDGRDLEATARQVYAERDGVLLGALRVLEESDGSVRIGRVVTAPAARSAGVATALVEHALVLVGGRVAVLNAQAHLEGFYERFGFSRSGPNFVEDAIPHVPMTRAAPGGGTAGG